MKEYEENFYGSTSTVQWAFSDMITFDEMRELMDGFENKYPHARDVRIWNEAVGGISITGNISSK